MILYIDGKMVFLHQVFFRLASIIIVLIDLKCLKLPKSTFLDLTRGQYNHHLFMLLSELYRSYSFFTISNYLSCGTNMNL